MQPLPCASAKQCQATRSKQTPARARQPPAHAAHAIQSAASWRGARLRLTRLAQRQEGSSQALVDRDKAWRVRREKHAYVWQHAATCAGVPAGGQAAKQARAPVRALLLHRPCATVPSPLSHLPARNARHTLKILLKPKSISLTSAPSSSLRNMRFSSLRSLWLTPRLCAPPARRTWSREHGTHCHVPPARHTL
jgi:hypothetical protein